MEVFARFRLLSPCLLLRWVFNSIFKMMENVGRRQILRYEVCENVYFKVLFRYALNAALHQCD
jgi:hypothetical protein